MFCQVPTKAGAKIRWLQVLVERQVSAAITSSGRSAWCAQDDTIGLIAFELAARVTYQMIENPSLYVRWSDVAGVSSGSHTIQ